MTLQNRKIAQYGNKQCCTFKYVTLPPEMSCIATQSLFGYRQLSKAKVVAILSIQRNQFIQSLPSGVLHIQKLKPLPGGSPGLSSL